MRKNRRNNIKRERVVMLASSALVLTALTLTGIYMQAGKNEAKDDGYTLDFTALEENAQNKYQEIAQNNQGTAEKENIFDSKVTDVQEIEDDLDYMPLEVDSVRVQIPGLTTNEAEESMEMAEQLKIGSENTLTTDMLQAELQEELSEIAETEVVETQLHFDVTKGLLRPLEGETLIPFSMDSSVYFSTLDQYKYNPALMMVAAEDMAVLSCAECDVVKIFEDPQIGHAVTVDLGDGYLLTYGQIKNINVYVGEHVSEGEVLGVVAAPTKYYSKEGPNLYLKLTQNDNPIDPESLFR